MKLLQKDIVIELTPAQIKALEPVEKALMENENPPSGNLAQVFFMTDGTAIMRVNVLDHETCKKIQDINGLPVGKTTEDFDYDEMFSQVVAYA